MMRGFLSSLLFLGVPWALCQEPEAGSYFSELNLEELLSIEVTVATKSEEKIADAPSSVTVFSRTEIQNMGVTTLNELLNYVPGFQAARDVTNGQEAAVYSRNTSSGQLSYHVLVLENGVRLNDSHAGGASLFTRLISLDNIKQVEVIRGPGSALYGSNAFLGVINIVTVDDVNEAKLQAGELGSRSLSFNFAREVGAGRISAFLHGFTDDGEEYPEIPNQFPTGVEGIDPLAPVRDPREGFDLQFRASFPRLAITGRYRERSFRDFYQFGLVGQGVNRDDNYHQYLAFKYDAVENDTHKLEISGAWVEGGYDARALLFPGVGPFTQGDFIGGPIQDHSGRNISLDYFCAFNENHSLHAGAVYREARNDRVDSLFNYDTFVGGLPVYLGSVQVVNQFNRSDIKRRVLGIYLQDQLTFWDRLKLIVGVRYDDYNDEGDPNAVDPGEPIDGFKSSTTNPRGALIYQTSFGAKYKLMYGEAFRAPSLNELFNQNNPVAQGSTKLNPERIETLEFAYVQEHPVFQSTVTYFYNRIRELIILVPQKEDQPDLPPPPPIYENGGMARVEGLEFELQAALTSRLLLRAAYSKILDGEEVNTPNDFGAFVLNGHFGDFNLNFNAIYRGDIFLGNETDADGNVLGSFRQNDYWVGNAKLRYDIFPQFAVHLSAQNLFDESYREFTASVPVGIPGRGRVVMFGGTWQF